jgi:hypothetical protein
MNEMKESEEEHIIEEFHSSDDATKQELQMIRNELKELKVLLKKQTDA